MSKVQRRRPFCPSTFPPTGGFFLPVSGWGDGFGSHERVGVDAGWADASSCQSQPGGGGSVEAAALIESTPPPAPPTHSSVSPPKVSLQAQRWRGGWREEEGGTEGLHPGAAKGGRRRRWRREEKEFKSRREDEQRKLKESERRRLSNEEGVHQGRLIGVMSSDNFQFVT